MGLSPTGDRPAGDRRAKMRMYKKVPTRFNKIECPFELCDSFAGKHGQVHYSTTGAPTAFPIVCLHGFNASRTMFTPHLNAIAMHGYFRAITMDFYGHGLSNAPRTLACTCLPVPGRDCVRYDLDLFVDQVLELFDHLGITSADLFGFSMGGLVAVAFAERYPQKVRKLALMSPAGFLPPGGMPPVYKLLQCAGCCVIPGLSCLIANNSWYFTRERRVKRHQDDVSRWPEAVHQKVVWLFFVKKGVPSAVMDTAKRMPWSGVSDLYTSVGQHPRPVLLLWGELDEVNPLASREKVVSHFPNSCLSIIQDAGHVALCEQVNRTMQQLIPFLHMPNDLDFSLHRKGDDSECLPFDVIYERCFSRSIRTLYPLPPTPPTPIRAPKPKPHIPGQPMSPGSSVGSPVMRPKEPDSSVEIVDTSEDTAAVPSEDRPVPPISPICRPSSPESCPEDDIPMEFPSPARLHALPDMRFLTVEGKRYQSVSTTEV